MKTAILNYFKTNRSYRSGVKLVIEYSPKLGLKKQLNIHPESDYLKGCVFEELRELAGISFTDLNTLLAMPLPKAIPLSRPPEMKAILNPDVDLETPDMQADSVEKPELTASKTRNRSQQVKKVSRKR
jgi:hypothetical protein